MIAKPHLGFVTTSFPRYCGDPAGSFVFGMARAFRRNGYPVTVVTPEPPCRTDWGNGPRWLEDVSVCAAPYARPRRLQKLFFGAGAPDNIAGSPLTAGLIPAAMAGLLSTTALRARQWDAVVSHWLLPSSLVAGVTRRRSIRHLAIAHSADVHLMRKLPFSGAAAWSILSLADHVGFISERLRREFIEVLSGPRRQTAMSRSSVTPMGIETDELTSPRSRSEIRTALGIKGFTLLFLGRLVPVKGVDVLLEAVAGTPGLQLIVAGEGPERARLENMARTRGAAARFMGEVDATLRAELLKACDVVVVPSIRLDSGRTEGLPLVVIEALAAGAPLMVSDTGAVSEIVEDGATGILLPPGNAPALKRALARISSDSKFLKKMAKRGRLAVEKRAWGELVPAYEKILLA